MKLAVAFVVALLCASPCFARDISSIVGNAICRISRDGETIESALGGIAKFPGAECLRCSCFGGILSCTDSGCEEYEHPKKCTPDFKRCGSYYYKRIPSSGCEFPACPERELLEANEDSADKQCPDDTHYCKETGQLVHREARLGCRFDCTDLSTPQPVDLENLTDEMKEQIEKLREEESKALEEEEAERRAREEEEKRSREEEVPPAPEAERPASEDDTQSTVMCPSDVKKCPDGSVVLRVGEDCHFPDCDWDIPEMVDDFWERVRNASRSQRGELLEELKRRLPGGLGSWRLVDRACLFGGSVVRHGWTGRSRDSQTLCNTCRCNDGRMECTRYRCEKPFVGDRSCTTSSGEVVSHGWSGKGSGDEWCKQCRCNDGRFYCRKGVCPSKDDVEDAEDTKAQCQMGDELLPHGYSGPGVEGYWCKQCRCNDGVFSCDKEEEDCPPQEEEETLEEETKVACELTSGKEVEYGWSGHDDSHNYCNLCTCEENANLNCDSKRCTPLEEEEEEDQVPPEPEDEDEEETKEEIADEEEAEEETEEEMVDEETTEEDEAPDLPEDIAEEEEPVNENEEADGEEEEGPPAIDELIPPTADEEEISEPPSIEELISENGLTELEDYFDIEFPDEVDETTATPIRIPGKSGKSCKFTDDREHEHAEVFQLPGDDNWCNACICNDGRVFCDEYECPEKMEEDENQDAIEKLLSSQLGDGFVEDSPDEDEFLNPDGSKGETPQPQSPSSDHWYTSTTFIGAASGVAGAALLVGAAIFIRRSRRQSQGPVYSAENPVQESTRQPISSASSTSRTGTLAQKITAPSSDRTSYSPSQAK